MPCFLVKLVLLSHSGMGVFVTTFYLEDPQHAILARSFSGHLMFSKVTHSHRCRWTLKGNYPTIAGSITSASEEQWGFRVSAYAISME